MHVAKNDQRAAVDFLSRQLFTTPEWMIDKDIISRIGSTVVVDLIRGLQEYGLNVLFEENRLNRMMENEALNGKQAYSMENLFSETKASIFSEVASKRAMDPYRRNLQRAYVHKMGELLMASGEDADLSDIKALARMTLKQLDGELKGAKFKNTMAQAHAEDLRARIELIQKGKMPAGESGGNGRGLGLEHIGCWH
jgi:hypothetical protein